MVDWKKVDAELVREILREAELKLQAQLSLAIAADQRSSVMASFFSVAAAAIAAGLITLASAEHSSDTGPIYAGGAISILLLIIGAALCIWAARPADFSVPGSEPDKWYDEVKLKRDLKVRLGEQAENCQEMIEENDKVLSTNARFFAAGAATGITSPLAGAIIWVILRFGSAIWHAV
jgi:hypothetical protein